MKTHFSLDDPSFERAFETMELDPVLFTHEAHIRLAWLHIKQYGLEKAVFNLNKQIKNFAEKHGNPMKYNKTVTTASVHAVAHFMARSEAENFSDFINSNPKLLGNLKGLLMSHYSIDIFSDEFGRTQYLEPDLIPFDHNR